MKGEFAYRRELLVESLREQGVDDERVLAALREIPRHRFVRQHLSRQAYGDFALPIEGGQTISQPFVVGLMSQRLQVQSENTVLEIGTGSGYQTAILAKLARWVFSLERVAELAQHAIARLRELGVENVKIQTFDGTFGWSDHAPFDRILVTAGAPRVPQPLLDQLEVEGLLVIPEGDKETQRLVTYRRLQNGRIERVEGEQVAFVPLLGRHGWQEV